MNEFIIWDGKYKLFLDENFIDTLQDNGIDYEDDDLYYGDEYYPLCPMDFIMGHDGDRYKDRISKLFYIGLDDIDNNKIYANCSIIEFGFIGFGESKIVTYQGFVKWNSDKYRYDIEVISHSDRFVFDLGKCIDRISNLKIVDTIQENKLGLMD